MSYLDPESINGLNLFTYCNNNPIMYSDSTGYSPISGIWKMVNNIWEVTKAAGRFLGGLTITTVGILTTIATAPLALIPGANVLFNGSLSLTMYGGFMMASSWDKQIAADANKGSFYKGQSIIHTDIFKGTFSFGVMFVDSSWHGDANTIKHEWGHFAQLNLLGWGGYMALIAIPSIFYNKTGAYINASYSDGKRMYYSKIWERTADWLGGVRSSNSYDPFCTLVEKKENDMRKTFSILILFLLILTGCRGERIIYDYETIKSTVLSVEIIEIIDNNEENLLFEVISEIKLEELSNFLFDLSELKIYERYGSPRGLTGQCIKLNYNNEEYEIIGRIRMIRYDSSKTYLRGKDITTNTSLQNLIEKYK